MNFFALRNSGFTLTAWCILLLNSPFARAASPLPQPLPNWRIELVAESPRIKHPSVVACAPTPISPPSGPPQRLFQEIGWSGV